MRFRFCVAMADERTASELFEEMKDKGVRPNVHTYNSLMNVFCNAPFGVLEQMFHDMQYKGILPNLRTYNTMMKVRDRQPLSFCKKLLARWLTG